MAELIRTKETQVPVVANKVTPQNVSAVTAWCGGVQVTEHDALQHDITFVGINVPTSNGMKRAQEGDYVIRNIAEDNFYVVSADRFDELFESVVDG